MIKHCGEGERDNFIKHYLQARTLWAASNTLMISSGTALLNFAH